MTENSDRYRTAVAGFDAVIDGMSGGDFANTSPCEGWTGKELLEHVIGGMNFVSSGEYGGEGVDVGSDPKGAYAAARDGALAALTDDQLGTTVQGPMGPMTLDQMMGMFLTGDVLIHTWDLAKTAGTDVTLDAGLVEHIYGQLKPMDAMIRMPNVFGPKVEPPAGADLQTEFMCFVGRQA